MPLSIPLLFFCGEILKFPEQPDIRLAVYEREDNRAPVYFLAPHQNERVINRYLRKKVKREGGKFLVIRQSGRRHLFLKFDEGVFEVDPNRIFTPRGARASLLLENPDLDAESELFQRVHLRAIGVGLFIIQQMGGLAPGSTVVAIHNNTDGYDDDGQGGKGTISIHRYQKLMERGAAFIKDMHLGRGDEDDLFFITSPDDFAAMKAAGWHVILQHPQVADLEDEDDGSLSVLAEKRGLRYINIEAQRKWFANHRRVQRRMTDFVFERVMPSAETPEKQNP